MKRATAPVVSLALVLGCVVGTMALGTGLKAACADGNWGDLRQYHYLCYSDIVPLLGTEQLETSSPPRARLPFIQACKPVEGQNCDEYPVLTMYFMRVAAWVSGANYSAFFYVNTIMLLACALVIALCLYMMTGARALYFALAPTLLIYGTMNWDLLAVAFATVATYLLLRRRDVGSGVMLGLGAAAKFYPGMLVVPFVSQRVHERRPDEAITLGWSTLGSYVVVNLPFAILGFASWREFFTFNAKRAADFDSLWYIGCRHWSTLCVSIRTINLVSILVFVGLFVLVWYLRAHRFPSFPPWTLGFPLITLFLLTNKVYSPQYGLWLLPWFALALPGLRRFIVFEAADVAVFVTRFWWFSKLSGSWGPSESVFEAMVLLRAAILIWCIVAWVRTPYRPLPIDDVPASRDVSADAQAQPA